MRTSLAIERETGTKDRDIHHAASSRRWIPTLLLLLFAGQSLWFIGTQSLVYDEPGHIFAGLEAWQHGRFEMWVDHPPLGRYWLTLPLARTHVEMVQESRDQRNYRVTAMQPGPEWVAWHTRPMNMLLGLALGLTLWFATRRLFSEGAANVALALFAFTPSLMAHFSLATTDGIGALFIFLAAFQLVRWRNDPSRRQTVAMGLILGGLLLAKLYTPPEVVLALVLMLVLGRHGVLKPRHWNWRPMLAALAIAALTFWAGYQFHVSHVTMGNGQIVMTFPNRPDRTLATSSNAQFHAPLPAGEYVEGLRLVALSNGDGRPTWFFGKLYAHGAPKFYFPAVIALKWPTVLLLLFFASLLWGVRKTCRSPGDLLILSLFGVLFLLMAMQSRITIGERHILPLYPFALLIAGGIWEHARRRRAAIALVVVLLSVNAADALRYAPGYLAYFNVLVKPNSSWRLLTDSNLDWGQGLIALRAYQQRHPDEVVHLAYFGSVAPKLYGIRAVPLAPNERVKGTVVASASCLVGDLCGNYDGYSWLLAYEPQQVLDHSMWVFNTTK